MCWRESEGGWLTPALLGAAIGVSFLAKYAALYFVIGIALTTLLDLETRRAVLSRKGALVGLIAAFVVAPHVAWNLSNGFQTVSHTVDNANLGGPLFNLDHLPKFLADQMGVFGPVGFLALIGGVFVFPRSARPHLAARDRWLLCFIRAGVSGWGSGEPMGRTPHDRSRVPCQVLPSTLIVSPSRVSIPVQ
jgi:4-amino-4-deoxy-L-arabinose transferase-like glycosyltransferase